MRISDSNSSIYFYLCQRDRLRDTSTSVSESQGLLKALQSNNSSSNSLTEGKDAISKVQESYQKIKEATSGLRDHAASLVDSSEESLFAEAEKNKDTSKIITAVQSFVKDYNSMITKMKENGGNDNNSYLQEYTKLLTSHEEDLKKIGITVKNGQLSVDEETLKKADIADLKKVFNGEKSFCDIVAEKSAKVEASATASMAQTVMASYETAFASYGSSGSYSDYGISSLLGYLV